MKNPEMIKRYSYIIQEYNEKKIETNDIPTIIPHYIEIIKAVESLNHDTLKEIIKQYYDKNKI